MPVGKVGVGGYTRKSKTGKTVHVSSYTQKRDLAAEMTNLGRSQVAAQPGQMPGGRAIPLSPGVSKVQLKAQKAQLAAARKQVAELRKQNPEVAAQVESTRSKLNNTLSAKKAKADKKAAKQKEISDAKKLKQTRGVDPEKMKAATETLNKAVQTEKNRKAAAEKAKASKAAKAAEAAKAKEPTPEEKQALEDYMWEGANLYKDLNGYLRTGQHEDNQKWTKETLAEKQAQLDSYMKKSVLESDLQVYRGINSDVLFDGGEPPMPGTVIRDDGFVSTSTSEKEAGWFGDAMLHITLPKGFHAIDTKSDEAEVLLPRGTQFKVTDIKDNGDTIVVEPILPDYLQEAPNGGQDAKSGQPEAGNPQASGQAQGQEAQQGVSGPNDVGSGGHPSDTTKPALTPEDLKSLSTPMGLKDLPTNEWDAASKAKAEEGNRVWGGTYAGHEFKVNRVMDSEAYTGMTDGPGAVYQGSVTTVEGKQVGSFLRAVSGDTVYHSTLTLDPSVQGQGIAHAFNKAAEEQYRNMGVTQIKTDAQDVGAYAWARAGYDWDMSKDKSEVADQIEQTLARIDDASNSLLDEGDLDHYDRVQEQLAEMLQKVDEYRFSGTVSDDFPTPFDLSQIGWMAGDLSWPGKTGMIGSNWSGVKKL